jgi:uncharacterized membrane protein HdeD (DUF308 family)
MEAFMSEHGHLHIRESVRANSNLFVAQGVIITLLGVAAVVWPQVSTLAVDLFAGWLFLLSGVLALAMMFAAPNSSGFFWAFLTGALSLFAGVLLLWHPVEGAVSLTLVLIAFFVAEGAFQTVFSFQYRAVFPESWGWMLFSGITDLILAGLIAAGLPGSAAWALGVIVGVNLITSGVAITMVAVTVRRIVGKVEKVFP